MKFEKINKMNILFIYKNLDYFLHFLEGGDARRKIITLPQENKDANQMHPFRIPEKH